MVKPKSRNGKRRTTIYCDAMLWKQLKYLAFMNETSVSRLLEEAAKEYLKHNRASMDLFHIYDGAPEYST